MGRRSNISRLPPKLQAELKTMVLERGRTAKELLAHIRSKGGTRISQDNVKSYLVRLRQKMERYSEAQQIAAVWVDKIGKEPEGNMGRLLIEMLRVVAFRQLAEMGDSGATEPRPAELAVIAKAIREMEAASKSIAERDEALREKLRSDVDRKAEQMKRPAAPGEVATLEKAKELVRGLL